MAKKQSSSATSATGDVTGETIYSSATAALTPDIRHDVEITTLPNHKPKEESTFRAIDPEEEYRFWESQYESSDEAALSLNFGAGHGPAYRYGIKTFSQHQGKRFDDIDQKELASAWENFQEKSSLSWDEAKSSVRKAYERLSRQSS